MRHLLRVLLPLLVLAGPLQGQASAVTVKELLEYKAKLSDDILIALIESDGSVFHLSITDVAALRDQGLSERVILAMLKTATKRPETAPSAPQPATNPVAVYAPPGTAVDQYGQPIAPPSSGAPTEEQPKAPVVVNVKQEVTQHVDQPASSQPNYGMYGYPYGYAFSPYVYSVAPVRPAAPPPPVYWGWGGQRRPDSWQPPPQPQQPTMNPTSSKTASTTPRKGGG